MSDSEDFDFLNELKAEIQKEEETPSDKPKEETLNDKQKEPSCDKQTDPVDIEPRSGFRIKKRLVSNAKCDVGLKNVEYVALKDVESRTRLHNSIHVGVKPSSHWSTIGVIDQCFPQPDLCVTRITDMRGIHIHLYITGKAFTKYDYAIGLGSVVAVKRPFLLKPTETGQSVALHVDQIQQMWVIGQSLDLVQCAGYAKKDMRCSAWTDSRTGEFCDKHLEKVYNYSKNGRMELASGNSGFDIRWATQIKQTDGTLSYESKRQKKPVDSVAKLFGNRFKSKQAYYIKGKGLVTTDGTIMKQALAKKEPTEAEKDELKKFLRGRRDPGAEMIRKIKGIEDEGPKTVLSNEALDKLGIGSKSLSKEEEESKKRSFEALNKATKENATENKKPRFVYL